MSGCAGIRAVVLDIEGTTSSISFVKDEMFPYARRRIPDYVRANAAAIDALLGEVRRIEGDPSLAMEPLIAVLLRWSDADRKITPLKTLQGLIWQQGFENGELRGHVYDDAVRALKRWRHDGLQLYVYSSGSVAAQKLVFSHTEYGDLTPLFAGHFDTTIGSKLESGAYRSIATSIGLMPEFIMYLSDHPGEIAAAANAGMKTVLVDRGEAPRGDRIDPSVRSFDEINWLGARRKPNERS
jgi:enolase-phosphatase E1